MECVQVIEDRQSSTVISQYVWSLAYIDGLVLRDDNSSGGNLGISGSGLGRRLYAQQDGNWNVTALLDAGGAVRERFVYDPYGNVQALDAGGNSGTDGYGWAYLHQGGRLDAATGLYHFRHRDYSAGMGRWVEEDPNGYGDGMNLYGYVKDNPINRLDSSGLAATVTYACGLPCLARGGMALAVCVGNCTCWVPGGGTLTDIVIGSEMSIAMEGCCVTGCGLVVAGSIPRGSQPAFQSACLLAALRVIWSNAGCACN